MHSRGPRATKIPMRFVLALLAVFCGFGVACGEDAAELSGPEEYSKEKRQFAQVFCACAAGETEPQPADSSCVRSYLGRQSACEEDILDERWDELQESGDCLREAIGDAKDCLLMACDVDACTQVLRTVMDDCPLDAQVAFTEECT